MLRFAIEHDKVRLNVKPGRLVIGRSGRQMSIIRRPAIVDPIEIVDLYGEQLGGDPRTCTCGWPGPTTAPASQTIAGIPFRFLAMATDNDIDKVGSQKNCGSMSFCGVGDKYPDACPMGYPFEQPSRKPLAQIVNGHRNMMMMPLVIKLIDTCEPMA
jgi:hypothetical protein